MLGDQQAALFGQGCHVFGTAKCTYGTGSFLLSNCGEQAPEPEAAQGVLATVAWRLGDRLTYALEGSVLISGALITWLRDGLGMIRSAAEVEELARSVPDTGGVVLVPAFAGLGTPHWDPDARALLIGMTRGTTRAHVARAALEAMAFQVREVQLAVEAVTGTRLRELRVDGGATQNRLLLEIQAALSELVIVRPANLETTAVGAFRMAMLGAGVAREPAGLPPMATGDGDMEVRATGGSAADAAAAWRRWRAAVERCRGWARVG